MKTKIMKFGKTGLFVLIVIITALGIAAVFTACSNTTGTTAAALETPNIHIAGYYTEGGVKKACYWKNGIPTILPSGSYGAHAQAIDVSGGSIHAAGYYGNYSESRASYWKDGLNTGLPGGMGSMAFGIIIE